MDLDQSLALLDAGIGHIGRRCRQCQGFRCTHSQCGVRLRRETEYTDQANLSPKIGTADDRCAENSTWGCEATCLGQANQTAGSPRKESAQAGPAGGA
jgi:hypothetical protein